MSSIQERLQLKRVPLDTWNIREQLCLASAVMRSGDQNWMSVSRALKTVGEPNRPPDWYSQKSCAAQYGALLEHVETPKRKKRSSEGAVETPQESILKRLTQERIVEIQKNVTEMNQQYEQLTNEVNEARNPATSEDRLRELWSVIETAKRARERESARRAAWLKEREERRARAERTWRPPTQAPVAAPIAGTPAPPSSPLLTSLLKSSPVVTTPQHISHPANVVDSISPSAGAPTLSMLLEKSAGGAATSPHESKHAAIEHIKNQLVQIEQQLKASSSTPPPAPLPPAPAPAPALATAPALDIDDIEIKAEDVYAFRDVDIHIPPVQSMHKGSARTLEKPVFKRDEPDIPVPVVAEPVSEHVQEIKEEPIAVEPASEDIQPAETENLLIQPPVEPLPEPAPAPEEMEPAAELGVKIAFPEVKFPTPEIKVIQPDAQKIKEEVKEPEVPLPEPVMEQEAEVNVEQTQDTVDEQKSEQPEPINSAPLDEPEPLPVIEDVPLPPPEEETTAPENIPLPPDPIPEPLPQPEEVVPVPDPTLPPEPEAPPVQEPIVVKQEVQSAEQHEAEAEAVAEETVAEDDKKEDDAEDSIPLKEMMREETPTAPPTESAAPEPEVKEEPPSELEETHTETDDDTPMELSREEAKDGKKRRDYSRKKKPDSRTCSGSESAAEASAPESPSASDAERQHRLWKKSVMLVYSRLCAHKFASLFVRPITDEEAPGYSLVVRRPMDLTNIRRNIEAGVIRTTAEFQRDVLLMLSNALMYNSSEHSVYTMAREMHDEALNQLGMLLAAQAHAGLVSAPPTALRRKRRRPESPLTLTSTPKRHH